MNSILSGLRGFIQFLVCRGIYPESPLKDIPPLRERYFIPFVFSPDQIEQLLQAMCKRLRRTEKCFLLDQVIYMAVLLMARCGMRISEPLRLLPHHYRGDDKTIYIEKTKFRKDRLIPMPKTAITERENYLSGRESILAHDENPYLLAGRKQKPLTVEQVRYLFRQAVKDIGLDQPSKVIGTMNFSQPTVHSLHHSFAVNSLKQIKERGKSPQHALPVLAAYMGHSEQKHTSKYLKFLDAEHRQGLIDFAISHQGEI